MYYVGQKFKNAPEDDFPYFELVKITESGSLKYYRLRSLFDEELELVLHEEDLYPYVEETTKIINKEVKNFEEGKTYMFIADTIQVRDIHKWAEVIDGEIVNVKKSDLGFITMNRPNRKPKEISIFPRFCYEVEVS